MAETTSVRTFAEYLTVGEAAEFLGLSPWTLRNWDNAGKLKPARHPVSGYRLYRREDLVTLLQSDQLQGKLVHSLTPNFDWNGIGVDEHCVQFYENDTYLIDAVSAFIGPAIVADAGALLIATPAHLQRIEAVLRQRGLDLSAARNRGQYVALDAQRTLNQIMAAGSEPDTREFQRVVASQIDALSTRWPRVRVFGEVVSLLWDAGQRDATCRLEQLWSELAKKHTFALLCAYPVRIFQEDPDGPSLEDVCDEHVRVVPTESYTNLSDENERLRTIATLQHKAQRLEAEVKRRREAEGELQAFLSDAAEGVNKISPDGVILWANRAELELLGYAPEEYIGRPLTDFHVDAHTAEEMMRRLGAGERLYNFPARLRGRDGQIRNVVIHASAAALDGETQYYRCFTHDVTRIHQSDRDRAMLAAIVDSSDDAIISKTLDGVIRTWNAAAVRLFGYTADEVVGKSVKLIIPHDRLGEETEILARLRQGERIEHFETVRRAKNGRLIDISLTISPIRDGFGRLVGASKIARDITDRIRADAALRRSEEQYRRLADLLPVAVYTCSAPDALITYYNQRAAELWGRSPTIGKDRYCGSSRLFDIEGREIQLEDCFMAAAVRDGRSVRAQEVIMERPDGSRITILVNIDPITESDGRISGAVNVFGDITALKQAEQALREADRRKDEFLATLAHELRNPLAPIRNSLNILRLTGGESPAVADVHRMMERQVAHLVRLVDDLLELSRISRGKIELRREPIILADVIEHAMETSGPIINESRHTLELALPDDPIYIDADLVRLSQVFANLLNNAAKYTDPGGTITISAERAGDEVLVAVRDTGIGIPADMLSRIFEMFTQVNSERRRQDGLGIGLSLVRTLVQMHGGTVEAHSDGPGCGSEFRVRLPVAAHQPADAMNDSGSRANQPPPGKSRRILIVDDNKDSADSLSMLLKYFDADVKTAYNGETALNMLEGWRPTHILMDLGMPGMDGCETARRIRQNPVNRDITLIALTGWGQEDDRRRSREAGFCHHLVKPLDIQALTALLASQKTEA